MKKATLILAMAVFVFSCAKKSTPTASASAPSGNSGSVVSSNAPAASSSSTSAGAATQAVLPKEETGAKSAATPAATSSPEVQGQSTYNGKCGKCHGLKVVSDYTADRWASILAVMGPKVHLNDAETANVMAYVKANAKK